MNRREPAAARAVEDAPTFRRPKVILPVPTPSPQFQHVQAGVPDTQLTREATGLLREFSTPLLFNHSLRVCAVFHDLGLTKKYRSEVERFEVDGANVAIHFLHHYSGSEPAIETAWDLGGRSGVPSRGSRTSGLGRHPPEAGPRRTTATNA